MLPNPFADIPHDRNDPNPWQAVFLDLGLPLDDAPKNALLLNMQSKSRQFFLPLIRPFTRLLIILFQLLKIVLPNSFAFPRLMHRLIYWGLKYCVSPAANYVILRHFHIGSEILAFIASNVSQVNMQLKPLHPENLEGLLDNVFIQHDLNLYNFIIDLNRQLRDQNTRIKAAETLNFDCITDGDFPIEPLPNRWHNWLDVQTAIEIYTPIYQLFLSDRDFWRATNSLQLDETIGLYVAAILGERGNQSYLSLINNKHPMVPMVTLSAGYRLVLHGLASECLHAILVQLKREQAGQTQD